MRSVVLALFAGLAAVLLAVPKADAGNYGCSPQFQTYYSGRTVYGGSYYPSYSYYRQPVYQLPAYYPAAAAYDTGYCPPAVEVVKEVVKPVPVPTPVYPDNVFRVAPELAYGRINEEVATRAATQAVEKYKAEQAAREAAAKAEARDARQEQILSSLADVMRNQQALAYGGAAGVGPPARGYAERPDRSAAMEEEIRQLRIALAQQEAAGQQQDRQRMEEEIRQLRAALARNQTAPPAAAANPPANPPAAPDRQAAPPQIPKAAGEPKAVVQQAFQKTCMGCHNKPERMNLSDVGRLTRHQLQDVYYRLTTNDEKEVMPPPGEGRKPVEIEVVNAVAALVAKAPAK